MPSLRLLPPVGAPIDVPRERVLIGRDPGCDVVVNDPSVSRRHVVVERRGEGWVVLDQQSANGTWLDNRRVDQAALQNGQQLRLGAVGFTVMLAEAPAAAWRPEAAPARAAAVVGASAAPSAPPAAAPAGGVRVAARAVEAPAPLPGPPGRPAAAPAGAGRMDEAEAAEILGLWPGSPAEEVRQRYQKMYNDFQIRLTNAPTPSLKKMYQKNIQDLKTAAETLSPGAVR